MDIVLLKTFLELARTRHFGKAAETLFVTQSAVSARIRLLESQLGVSLFHRRRNDIQLTGAGQRLMQHAETIVRGWYRARQEVALDGALAGSLAIGTSLDLWDILLRGGMQFLRAEMPERVVNVEIGAQELLLRQLLNGLLDLALFFDPPQAADLQIAAVMDCRLRMVSSRSQCTSRQAFGGDYYLVDWGTRFAQEHARLFAAMPGAAARLNCGVLARDLLLDSGGSAYLAEPMVRRELAQGQLFAVADAPVIPRTVHLAWRNDQPPRDALERAIGILRSIPEDNDRTRPVEKPKRPETTD
jgi:DNA-binding transcriptional LysR family regulator